MIHRVENSEQLTTISDMVTMATYTIRVLAFDARGDGPLSNPIQVKTQQGGESLESVSGCFFFFIGERLGSRFLEGIR